MKTKLTSDIATDNSRHPASLPKFRANKPSAGLLLSAFVYCLGAPSVHCETSVGTSLSSYGLQSSGAWEQNFGRTLSSPSGPFQDSYTSESGAVATANAAVGVLSVSTSRVGVEYSDPFLGGAKSTASAHWQDLVTINSAGRKGQTGYAIISFTVNGKVNVSGSYGFYTEYRLLPGAPEGTPYKPDQGTLVFNQAGLPTGTPFIGIPQHHHIQIVFGQPTLYALNLVAAAEVHNHYPGSASVSLSNDAGSGRFRFHSVTDTAGNPVPYTMASRIPTDSTRPNITLRSLVASLDESAQTGSFEIQLDRPAPRNLSVLLNYGGTATRTSDYKVSSASSVAIPKGATRALVNVTTINDRIAEQKESVRLTLLNSSDYNLAVPNIATIYIQASDL